MNALVPVGAASSRVRDYDREERGTGLVKPYGVKHEGGKRHGWLICLAGIVAQNTKRFREFKASHEGLAVVGSED